MQHRPIKNVSKFAKIDFELRVAYGWASVAEVDGKPVVDLHGHTVPVNELVKGAHDFVSNARVGLLMHSGRKVAEIVESCVFTQDIQKALKIDLGMVGWWIGMKVLDDEVWQAVKSGDFPAFSIAGTAFVIEEE